LDKKKLYALLITATIMVMMVTATTKALNPATPKTCEDNITLTRNLTAPPPQTEWNKTYGGTQDDAASSVQQTSDGGYILAGYTKSSGKGGQDFWLVKTDSAGNQQWNKTYGGAQDDEASSVQQTSDGGYILAGTTRSSGAGFYDLWLVKTDSAGNQQWNKTYGGTDADGASSVQQTSDGGYIIAGFTFSFGNGFEDFWLVKTNSSGNQEWNRTYGGTGYEVATSVQETFGGGYILAGETSSVGFGHYDFWLVKTGNLGYQQWNKTYGGTDHDSARSVQQTSDGGYIIAGLTDSFGAGSADFLLVKTDLAGSLQWNKTYGGTQDDEAYSVRQTSDGGYIAGGYSSSFGAGSHNFWLVKTGLSGYQQWNKTYLGTSWYEARSVQQTSDGGYIVGGSTNSTGHGGFDFWLLKTLDGTPPSTILDLTAGTPTNASITLTWTAPGDDGMSGNATGYVVKYSTSGPVFDSNWASATTYTQSWTPAKNGTTETHVITGLTAGTSYWFVIKAYDDASPTPNYSEVSNSATETTTGGQGFPMIVIIGGVAVAAVAVVLVAIVLMKRKKV
jgi:hypothetical protein